MDKALLYPLLGFSYIKALFFCLLVANLPEFGSWARIGGRHPRPSLRSPVDPHLCFVLRLLEMGGWQNRVACFLQWHLSQVITLSRRQPEDGGSKAHRSNSRPLFRKPVGSLPPVGTVILRLAACANTRQTKGPNSCRIANLSSCHLHWADVLPVRNLARPSYSGLVAGRFPVSASLSPPDAASNAILRPCRHPKPASKSTGRAYAPNATSACDFVFR